MKFYLQKLCQLFMTSVNQVPVEQMPIVTTEYALVDIPILAIHTLAAALNVQLTLIAHRTWLVSITSVSTLVTTCAARGRCVKSTITFRCAVAQETPQETLSSLAHQF